MTEDSLFLEALRKKDPEQRKAFLDEACGEDKQLRQRIDALLATLVDREEGQAPDELPATKEYTTHFEEDELGFVKLPETENMDHSQPPNTVIAGRYILAQKLGEGGMGEVWVAKQTSPVTRMVAVKLIKSGMDSKQVLARFDAERQALALMDHPNIAKVLDGGITENGRPFFVLELVNGLQLSEFCDGNGLTPRQRLELFVPVCQAVQHAHQKGIVHRDLKPSNILVTIYDGKPVPKVIDFGVAKATGGKLGDETLNTQLGTVIGTTEYMSPEQAGSSAVDIDTRADIYSLGVILYELLTGLRPFDPERLRQVPSHEAIRIIREEEPLPPSARLSTAECPRAIFAARKTDPKKLKALMRGELDWVVMKCLEKDRSRRYETASSLARDIERYLGDEAVEARPPSTTYRLGKFLRRNKKSVVAVVGICLALVVGLVGASWGYIRADRARHEAEKQRDRTQLALTQQLAERIESNLKQLEGVGHGLATLVQNADLHGEEDFASWMRVMLARDKRIHGLAVAFSPGKFQKDKEYGLFIFRNRKEDPEGSRVEKIYLHEQEGYNFLEKDWYKDCIREKRPGWDAASVDVGNEVLIGYIVPIWRTMQKEKKVVGVVSVDVSIRHFFHNTLNLNQLINQMGLGHGYGFVVCNFKKKDNLGLIISHPHRNYDFSELAGKGKPPRFVYPKDSSGFIKLFPGFKTFTDRIVSGKEKTGIALDVVDPWTKQPSTFLFARIPSAKWTLVAVIQPKEVGLSEEPELRIR